MKLSTSIYSVFLISALMTGCSAMELKPGAERIVMSRKDAPKSCNFKGNVVGSQGNFFTGAYTSSQNLTKGSINDMKNQAAVLGANYVMLDTHATGDTISGGNGGIGGGQTNVTMSGSAYLCPPKDIGLE